MSGHSKWNSIKHKKAAVDAKRGKMFTKVIKEISVAARSGGSDPETNPRLRTAISSAKTINMPSDNVERAIKRGTGELPGVNYESMCYEGYGPGGIAILVDVLTDNKNRTHPELRKIFEKGNGSLGAAGCVAWMFTRKGVIMVLREDVSEDALMDIVLDAGAEDIDTSDDEVFIVYSSVIEFESVKKALEDAKIKAASADLAMVPNPANEIKISQKDAQRILSLMEELEDHDDVQNVYSNFDIVDEDVEGQK